MRKTISILLLLLMSFSSLLVSSQTRLTTNSQNSQSIEKILKELDVEFSVEKCHVAFDLAKSMSFSKNDSLQVEKGVNTLAYLAKKLSSQVSSKSIDLDAEDTKSLILKFEQEKYFIQKPKVSRFIKTMNYFCKGEYYYVHQKLVNTWYYKVSLIFVSMSLVLFVVCFSNKFNWRFKKAYKLTFFSALLIFIIVFIAFKLTCQTGIEDYSFYGFEM